MSKAKFIVNASTITKIRNAKDFDNAIQLTRWLLQPFGIWPLKSPNYLGKILRPISNIICLCLIAFLVFPCILHMVLIDKNFTLVGPVSFALISFYKYIIFCLQNHKMSSCIIDMAVDWHGIETEVDKKIMIRNSNTAKIFTVICLILMFASGMSYNIVLPLILPPMVVDNVTYKFLSHPPYYFGLDINPYISPLRDCILFVHFLTGIVMYSLTSGVCGILTVCSLHISSRCDILSSMFQTLAKDFNYNLLGVIVKEHWKSLRFASKLEETLNAICLVEMVGSSINLCLLGYYFVTNLEDSDTFGIVLYSLLLCSLTFNIFIFCYVGETLTEQCENIGTVIYTLDWYNLSAEQSRNLLIIIILTQRPVVLTAGKMVTLSIKSFSNVIKTAATYFNMLRAVTVNS